MNNTVTKMLDKRSKNKRKLYFKIILFVLIVSYCFVTYFDQNKIAELIKPTKTNKAYINNKVVKKKNIAVGNKLEKKEIGKSSEKNDLEIKPAKPAIEIINIVKKEETPIAEVAKEKSILKADFQYGKANVVDDYSWNIDLEPHIISEDLRKIHNDKEWFYMTDNINYYPETKAIKPDYAMPFISCLTGEWDYMVKLSAEKILGAFLNDMPYKFLNVGRPLPKKTRKPNFSKEVQLAITYAPKLAVPLAEIDLLFSSKSKIQDAIERLAYAYYRAGEVNKLQKLFNSKSDFKYPKINWGNYRKYIVSASFGKTDNFWKHKKNFHPTHITYKDKNKYDKPLIKVGIGGGSIVPKDETLYLMVTDDAKNKVGAIANIKVTNMQPSH